MRSRAFANYYRYKVNGRRVKSPRKTASIGITGIVFSKGLRHRNGVTHVCPALRVYAGGERISSHPLKSLSAQIAFHAAVKSRFAKEGRAYKKKKTDELFHAWLSKREVKSFLVKNNIPIYSDEQLPKRW